MRRKTAAPKAQRTKERGRFLCLSRNNWFHRCFIPNIHTMKVYLVLLQLQTPFHMIDLILNWRRIELRELNFYFWEHDAKRSNDIKVRSPLPKDPLACSTLFSPAMGFFFKFSKWKQLWRIFHDIFSWSLRVFDLALHYNVRAPLAPLFSHHRETCALVSHSVAI